MSKCITAHRLTRREVPSDLREQSRVGVQFPTVHSIMDWDGVTLSTSQRIFTCRTTFGLASDLSEEFGIMSKTSPLMAMSLLMLWTEKPMLLQIGRLTRKLD